MTTKCATIPRPKLFHQLNTSSSGLCSLQQQQPLAEMVPRWDRIRVLRFAPFRIFDGQRNLTMDMEG